MPVVSHRQHRLGSAACRNSTSSYSSTGSGRDGQLWIVQENGDHHRQKTMDFPAPRKASVTAGQKSRKHLRLDTYSKPDLHDRYLSSEEEVSPSPHENFDIVSREDSTIRVEQGSNNDYVHITPLEAEVMTGIAIVVNIINVGKPKVIDIPRLAPRQKRRSSNAAKPPSHPAHGSVTSQYSTKSAAVSVSCYPANEAVEVKMGGEGTISPREDSLPDPQPNLPLLPQVDFAIAHEASLLEFPGLDIRPTPSYRDYDPYLLNPPRLHSQYQRSLRSRANPGPGFAWKGGMNSNLTAVNKPIGGRGLKKGKKLMRRANERAPMMPTSPFQDGNLARRIVVG
ncbi:MAG: hypothetical protein M1830_008851 [Pleopsidium flavum]|nr:MAG: hypothetical protein M1830_008851 [Pleopsidium flavum]